MTQYNTLNTKWSHLKLESGIKNGTEATLKLSSNFVGDSNDDGNFLQRLLLIITQVSRIRKTFANGSSANVKFSKTQLSKMVKLARFSGRFLGLLIKTGLPSIRNVLKPLAKSLLVPLGVTAVASATDAAIQKKSFGSSHSLDLAPRTTTLTILNEELNNIIKVVIYLEDSSLLIKGVTEPIKITEK